MWAACRRAYALGSKDLGRKKMGRRTSFPIGVVVLLSLLGCNTPAPRQPAGSLDASFGADGMAVTSIGSGGDYGRAVAVQPDGKIVVAGYSYTGAANDFAVVRYQADGSLDPGFGGDGLVTTPIGANAFCYAVALQADGKIIAAGDSNWNFILVRYNTNGSLDTTFSGDGIVNTDIGTASEDACRAVAVQGDGKIVAAGYSTAGVVRVLALVRYNADGSLDTDFDGDGKVTNAISVTYAESSAVAIQPLDGCIVAAGYLHNGSNEDFAVVRYTGSGALDVTFAGDGIATTDFGVGTDGGSAVAIQPDGKIVVGGYGTPAGTSYYDFAIARYNTDGSPDTDFAADGKAIVDLGPYRSICCALALQADSKVILSGYAENSAEYDLAVIRCNSDGSLDSLFGENGIVTVPLSGTYEISYGIALQADGKIVVAGCLDDGLGNSDIAVLRFHP
jgi:uncharacterized delta-60 repeat protein